jgi:hypothetical protein
LIIFVPDGCRDQLKRKMDQAEMYKQQLKEACGENDYNSLKDNMSGQISFLRE